MKQAFEIFRGDISRLFHNFAALLVVGGVCCLPSLYAWFNIAANMNPYGNTQAIQVAVSNNDTTVQSGSTTLNAGDRIVDQLKENHQLGWVFVDEATAVEGVRSGKYYAAIVIPDNFSRSLLSILSGDLEHPTLDYYVNEKENAIAPKITDTGATTVQQDINDTFSSVATKAISEALRTSASDLSTDMDQADLTVLSAISDARSNLSAYNTALNHFLDTAQAASDTIAQTDQTIASVQTAATSSSDALAEASSVLKDAQEALKNYSAQASQQLALEGSQIENIYSSASDALDAFEAPAQQSIGVIDHTITLVEALETDNKKLITSLESLKQSVSDDTKLDQALADAISVLKSENNSLDSLLASLKSTRSSMEDTINTIAATQAALDALNADTQKALKNYQDQLERTILPELEQTLDELAALCTSMSDILHDISTSTDQLKLVLDQMDTSLSSISDALQQTSSALTSIEGQLDGTSKDLHTLQSSALYRRLLSLDDLNATAISDFMYSPVTIQSETLYPVKNYGSAMTPFYTNLALWVGGLILTSIFKLEVPPAGKRAYTPTQAYLGRLLLFICLAVVQSSIACLGNIVLLKVQCDHPVAFLCAGILCSFVYVNLIYALAISFKHIGKALCVILVILQIPGSSGTYPIEMMPELFQKLCPLLPFTYGINAMREAIAGMYKDYYVKNLLALVIYLLIALFIGLVLRPLLMNLNRFFDDRLSEAEIMVGETASMGHDWPKLHLILHAMLNDEDGKADIIQRSLRFEALYPKLIRFGFRSLLVIPSLFLILMFTLEYKLVFLVLWILILIAVAIYLICVEYFHEQIQQQLALSGLTLDDLLQKIQEEKQ